MTNFDPVEFAHIIFDVYKQLKIHMCTSAVEEENTPIPIIQWLGHDGNVEIMGYDYDTSRLAEVVVSLREKHGSPLAIAFSSDARYRILDAKDVDNDKIKNYQKGQMLQDFLEGDMTVKDALITVVNTPTESHSLMTQYSYDDQGLPVFEEPVHTTTYSGLVSESLAHAFASLN
jgi:hypothetical protein